MAPDSPAAPVPAGPEAAAPRRGRLAVRVFLGLALAAVGLALALRRSPEALEISWRLEESAPAGRPAARLERLRPGQAARLVVALRPGPGAPAGAALVCGPGSRPRLTVAAPEGLVFDRPIEHLVTPDDEVAMAFVVEAVARPGRRVVTLRAQAELSAPGRSALLPAEARREIVLEVGAEAAPAGPVAPPFPPDR